MKPALSTRRDLEDWELVCRMLPAGWREAAVRCGALRRARRIGDAETLLRVLWLHLVGGCSLQETAVRAGQAGWARLSGVAVFKRLRGSGEWLRWMAVELRREMGVEGPGSRGRRLRAVDATVVSEPGSRGTDWRVHWGLDLGTLECDYFELTGVEEGETLRRFPVVRGDVLVADRGYAGAVGVGHVLRSGGDVVVRWPTGRPLRGSQGGRLSLVEAARGLQVGEIRECEAGVVETGQVHWGRLVMVRRSEQAAAAARRRCRKKLRRRGLSPIVYEAARYCFVWTSLSREQASAEQVLEWYRGRWQIELAFKRLKSLLGLGHLPKTDPGSAKAWLAGKLVAGLLVQRMLQQAGSFSPWGYALGEPP